MVDSPIGGSIPTLGEQKHYGGRFPCIVFSCDKIPLPPSQILCFFFDSRRPAGFLRAEYSKSWLNPLRCGVRDCSHPATPSPEGNTSRFCKQSVVKSLRYPRRHRVSSELFPAFKRKYHSNGRFFPLHIWFFLLILLHKKGEFL